jgi:hypothetical protein
MGFKLELVSPDGDNLGSIESNEGTWQPGDELRAHGNVRYRVTAVTPHERISEFVDEPMNGVLEVEPI